MSHQLPLLLDASARPKTFLPSLRLDSAETENDKPVWIQLAKEGEFRGYHEGPFKLTREVFDRVVANLHAHPSFKAGPDGVGTEDVIQLDHNHVSAMDPRQGQLPETGAPAIGWLRDMQVRDGANGAELWALAMYGARLRAAIKAKEFRWTSVLLEWSHINPVSGLDQGPTVTSVAVTNNPFIQGMAPLAATISVWGKAESADEAALGLREMLGLPIEAEPAIVLTEIQRFAEMLAADRVPAGVDTDSLLSQMRSLLGLPTLAGREDILAAASSSLQSLIQTEPEEPAERQAQELHMDPKLLIQKIALALKCDVNDTTQILRLAEDGVQAADALSKLKELFGAQDTKSLIKEAAKAIELATEMAPLLDALMQASSGVSSQQDTEVEEEVAAVAASHFTSEDLRKKMLPVLTGERTKCFDEHSFKLNGKEVKIRLTNADRLAAFRKEWPIKDPKPADDQAPTSLAGVLLAGPGGQQLRVPVGQVKASLVPGGAPKVPAAQNVDDAVLSAEVLQEIDACPGRNQYERAISYLCAKHPATFTKRPWNDQIRCASTFLKTGRLVAAA